MSDQGIKLAVVGAHLRGQPLNSQLTECSAKFLAQTTTAKGYRLYALPNTTPPKPGLVRSAGGAAVEVEVWELDAAAFGNFVAAVPSPLVIGTLELENGENVKGFLCEGYAVEGAREITRFGGWRAYLESLNSKA